MSNSDSTLTRDRIIRRAFKRVGLDSPSTTEMADGAEVLSDVIAELDPEGKHLWTISNTESKLTLVSGQRSYAVGTGAANIPNYIQAIQSIVIEDGVGSRTPLRLIDKNESLTTWELQNSSVGDPYLAYLEIASDPADQKLHFFPTPSAALTIKFTYQRMLYDMDAASDTPDLLRSMRLSLIKILAMELAPDFGMPDTSRQILVAEGEQAKRKIKEHNHEQVDPVSVVAKYY